MSRKTSIFPPPFIMLQERADLKKFLAAWHGISAPLDERVFFFSKGLTVRHFFFFLGGQL